MISNGIGQHGGNSMVKREYKMVVVSKREGTQEFREILLKWEKVIDVTTPFWLLTDPMGTPMPLQVTPEEYNDILIGDTVLVTIETDFTMVRLDAD